MDSVKNSLVTCVDKTGKLQERETFFYKVGPIGDGNKATWSDGTVYDASVHTSIGEGYEPASDRWKSEDELDCQTYYLFNLVTISRNKSSILEAYACSYWDSQSNRFMCSLPSSSVPVALTIYVSLVIVIPALCLLGMHIMKKQREKKLKMTDKKDCGETDADKKDAGETDDDKTDAGKTDDEKRCW